MATRKERLSKKATKGLYLRGPTWWTGVTHPSTSKRKLISLGTTDVREAQQFRAALLASSEHRANAHDLVEKVLDGSLDIRAFYAAWVTRKTQELRQTAKDADLTAHIEGWTKWLTTRAKEPVTDETSEGYERIIRDLTGKRFPVSKLTARTVEKWLDGMDGIASATRKRRFAVVQSFVKYLKREGVLSGNPLDTVEVPSAGPARDRHFTHEQTLKVLSRITESETRAYFALALGSGMERSALDALTLSDVNAQTHIIRARGTKNQHRDRYIVVSPWAWSYVAEQLRGKVGPSTKLFTLDYKRALDAFYTAQIVAGYAEPLKDSEGEPLGVTEARKTKGVSFEYRFHTLHDCRHTYAVVRLTGQDGEPRADLQAIADQLGHADLQMVSRIYARHRSAIQQAAEAAFHAQPATSGATKSEASPKSDWPEVM